METILLVLVIAYLMKISFFFSGSVRASSHGHIDFEPAVSIIIAARDEEKNIGNCLEALSRISYPSDKCEIFIIDDLSTDATADIVRSWQEKIPNLTYMKTEGVIHNLQGKANAVAQAIMISKGEIILTSDADCQVPPDWVQNTVRQYTPEVGCVCGFTLIKTKDVFSGMQLLDWAYLLTIASAGVGWSNPLSAVGNNMSFRRKAYDDVGGYEAVGFSVTEDFVLFKTIAYKSDWKVRYPVDPDTLVWSEPCANLKEVYHQKKRWGRGGLEIPALGWMIMSVGFFLNLGLMILPFYGLSLSALGLGVLAKFVIDVLLLQYPLRKMGLIGKLKYFFVFELYFFIYLTVLPFVVALTGKVIWKGRKL
jgi:cellulose synthase/poly-beta-1,6-N-acetylglucosamine synthase-like glycosyltransferase